MVRRGSLVKRQSVDQDGDDQVAVGTAARMLARQSKPVIHPLSVRLITTACLARCAKGLYNKRQPRVLDLHFTMPIPRPRLEQYSLFALGILGCLVGLYNIVFGLATIRNVLNGQRPSAGSLYWPDWLGHIDVNGRPLNGALGLAFGSAALYGALTRREPVVPGLLVVGGGLWVLSRA